jgi:predicted extracellular nuclease
MVRPQPGLVRLSALALIATTIAVGYSATPGAVSTGVVISQVYGGGGNSGATYTHDFIELFNRGDVAVSIEGWSVQYASSAGTSWQRTNLSGTIPAGGYYLVQQAQGAGGTTPLPTPDASGAIPMAGGAGKVALVNSVVTLSVGCPAGAAIVDFVGYGAAANCFEGSDGTATLTNTTAAIRNNSGCTDTDDNLGDFTVAAPTPRNSASALAVCSGPSLPTLSIDDVTVDEGESGTAPASFTVSLSAPAPAGGVTFDIATEDGTATAADSDYAAQSVSAAFIAPGDQTYTFNVLVNGDATAEADESFIVRVTGVTGALVGKSQGTGIITNDDNVVIVSREVVISQVYGGGGNAGATYTNDFIELFNAGNSPINLTGWSVQYASAAGATWTPTALAGVIQPGQYFLVRQAAGTGGTTPLPAPDAIGGIAMAGGAGKVALVGTTTPLAGTCPASAQIADFVGYGGASCFEGPGPTPALSNTTAALRNNFGCFDSDENSNDFTVGPPTPRNSASPFQSCAGFPALLSINDVSVDEGDSGTTTATFTVSLSPRAPAEGVTFDIATADNTATGDNDYVARSLTGQVIPAGQRFYTFDVVVNGDTIAESRETFFVNVTNVTGADIRDGQATGTILSKAGEFPSVAIHTIQGNGLTTPYFGQDVTTTGIVTGLKENGFFLQAADLDADADPGTSEGIFVFTSVGPSVLVGSAVVVNGLVTEFFNLTQIESRQPGDVITQSLGNGLPAPVMLAAASLDPDGSLTQLERHEAMRVHADALVSVAPTNDFGETFTVFAGVPRPMREPGIDITLPVPPDPTTGVPDGAIPRWDRNPERLMVVGPVDAPVTSNVTFTNVTGPLDFTFSNYKVLPDGPLVRSADMVAGAVPVPAANEFTVAGYNIENFAGNETQRRKAALAIRTVMRSPDVIGTIEIGGLVHLQALAEQVNADAVAAGEPNPAYEARLLAGGSQNVGFLVKTSRVQIDSVTEELAGETFPAGSATLLHDRPPLVLRAHVQGPGLTPEPIIVVVNHLRSFIDIDLLSAEGERVRAKRTAQAESVALLLQDLQTGNPRTPVISVGDYNAYEFNDGYTDPMAILRGQPTSDEQIVVDASPDSVNPDFVNLTGRLSVDQRYSFIFEGTPQALDHVLVNESALALLQRYAIARNNSDFPTFGAVRSDVTRPEGNSDHDMPVAYFAFTGTPVVTLNGDATMTVEAYTSFVDPGATARDGQGALPVTVSGSVDVNVPGEYTITYTASNALHETSVTRTVLVVDSTAPSIDGFSLTPSSLGSPNHKLVDVALLYSAADASGTVACSVAVSSNEAANGAGDGSTAADWQVVNDRHVRLRAERSGQGTGRIYTVTLTCRDNAGNVSSASATASVK